MHKKITNLFLFFFSVAFFQISYAQVSVTAEASSLKFMGDVGKKGNANYFSDMRFGAGLGVEYRIGKILGIGVNGIFGKLAGTDNDKTSHLNFDTKVMGGGLNVFAFFDKLGEKERDVSPYIHAGVGYLMFDPYGDLKDKNGTSYNYWKDGSIRNLVETPQNEPLSTLIKRDYTYETQLKDSAVSYARNSLFIPLGLGAKFKIGYRTSLRIGATYNIALTDYIDNYKTGGNDSWTTVNIGLNVHFGKKPKDGYTATDFDELANLDSDFDGVKDALDKCMGTPKGIKVDSKGCPEDKDGDGVFDYMDKELTTQKGANVDENGVTLDELALSKRNAEWDSLAVERSEGFNNAPSATYLAEVEAKAKQNQSSVGKASNLPAEFVEADYDKDGYISAGEITKTIDGFFDGESSFTVEKINKLIDFFFEQ